MLKEIAIVTVMVGNLDAVETAYRTELNYEIIDRGSITEELARSWGAANVSGNEYLIMRPESREPVYLRFIQSPNFDPEFVSLRSSGWNAIEILAEDPDEIARRLKASPNFEVVGEPAWLTEARNIKAMQATGPANELLYLTNIKDAESSGFGLDGPKSFVDRVFIMVVGGPDLEELRRFYATTLGLTVSESAEYRIRTLSRAYDLPDETRHAIAVASLSSRFLLELDQYPDSSTPRPVPAGELPPGIAMVTFYVAALDELSTDWQVQSNALQAFPYNGRRSALLTGPAGELIEVIEGDSGSP